MAEVQDPIKRKKLYDYLAKNQMTDLDFDTFSREYATNPEKTNKLYSYLKSNNMTDLDENTFKTEYFGDIKKKSESETSKHTSTSAGTGLATSPQTQVDGSLESPASQVPTIQLSDAEVGRTPQRTAPTGLRLPREEDFVTAQAQGIAPPQSEVEKRVTPEYVTQEELQKKYTQAVGRETTSERISRFAQQESDKDPMDIYDFNPEDKKILKQEIDNEISAKDLNIKHPYQFYSQLNKSDGQPLQGSFVDQEFKAEKLEKLGVNPIDFDGFLTQKGLKETFAQQEQMGLFDGEGRGGGGQEIQLSREVQKQRMLSLYLEEMNNRENKLRQLETDRENLDRSGKDALSSSPVTIFSHDEVVRYIEEEMPLLSEVLKKRDEENKEILEKHRSGEAGFWYGTGQTLKAGWNGLSDRINDLSATSYAFVGANKASESIRMMDEENAITRPNLRDVAYASGKKINYQDRDYIVDERGRVIDTELKIDVTDTFTGFGQLDNIRAIAKESEQEDWVFSPQGTAIQAGNVIGDMLVQVALTRGAASGLSTGSKFLAQSSRITGIGRGVSMSSIPMSKELSGAIIAQSAMGYSSGLEETLKVAREAGIPEQEAQRLASDAAQRMAVWYAMTAPLSPQTKATESIFGSEKRRLIKDAINAYTSQGKKGFVQTIKEGLKTIPRKGVVASEEGLKEVFQENVQQSGEINELNRRINIDAGMKLLEDTMTVDDVVNTSVLSFIAGTTMAQMKLPSFSSSVDRLSALKKLAGDDGNTNWCLDNMVRNGTITAEQSENLKKDIKTYQKHSNAIPQNLNPEVALTVMNELSEIDALMNKRNVLNPVFQQEVDQQIKEKREKVREIQKFSLLDNKVILGLKEQASKELQSEQDQNTDYTITDQQITERAIEIYNRNEETAEQAQEQEAQPQAEVQEEGAEVTNEEAEHIKKYDDLFQKLTKAESESERIAIREEMNKLEEDFGIENSNIAFHKDRKIRYEKRISELKSEIEKLKNPNFFDRLFQTKKEVQDGIDWRENAIKSLEKDLEDSNDYFAQKTEAEETTPETTEETQEQKAQTSTPVINTEAEAQAGEYFTRDIGGDQVVYRRNEDGTASIVPDSEAQNILSQPTIDAEIQTETTPTIEETQTADETTPTTDIETDAGVQPGTVQGEQQGQAESVQTAVEPTTSETKTEKVKVKAYKNAEFEVTTNEKGEVTKVVSSKGKEVSRFIEKENKRNKAKGKRIQENPIWNKVVAEYTGELTENQIREETKKKDQEALNNLEPSTAEDVALKALAEGQQVDHESAKRETRLSDKEVKWATGYPFGNKTKKPSVAKLSEQLHDNLTEEAKNNISQQDIYNKLIEFIGSLSSRQSAVDAIVSVYNQAQEAEQAQERWNYMNSLTEQERSIVESIEAEQAFLDELNYEQKVAYYEGKIREKQQAEQAFVAEESRRNDGEQQRTDRRVNESPELKEVNRQIEQAQEAVKKAQTALDNKAKKLDKTIVEDQENLFGERDSQQQDALFDERVDLAQRERATQAERQAVQDAKNKLSELREQKKRIEEGEGTTGQIDFDSKQEPTVQEEGDGDVQAQGISADTSNQRDTTLSDAGPVKNRSRRQNIFRRFWNNTFMSDQGAPKKLANIVRSLIGERSAYSDMLAYEVGVYNKILNKVKGRTKKSYNEAALAINDYLMGNENADVSFLTPQEREQIDYFRERVDGLSDKLVRNLEIALERAENKGQEETAERITALIETIKGNKGSYLHRTYEAFTNENYLEELTSANPNKSAKDRIQKAVDYIMAENDVTEQEARRQLFEYLDGLKNQGDFVTASANGRAKAPFLKKRQEIPVEIRELLGETKDPIVNYVNTVFKISDYISTLEYQQRLSDYLYDTGIGTTEAKEGHTRLVPQSEGWQVLSDIFVPTEIKEAIEDLQPLQTINSSFYRNWVKIAAMTKLGKTVLSATTTMRNILSGTFLGLNAGFFFASNPKRMVTAFQQAFGTKKTQTELLEERQKMIKMGVLNDGAVSGEILATMNDFSKTPDRMIKKSLLEKGLHVAQMVYKFGDDFYKVIGYYHFKSLYQKNGFTEAEAEAKAAERITQTFPTYSRIPRNIQKLRRLPVIGSFPSFAWEVWRTTKNSVEYIGEDIAEKRYGMAARQAAGTAIAYSAAYGLSVFTKSLYGIDDDEDDFIRDGSPEWQRNSLLIYTGKEDGKPTFLDATALFPSETIQKPIRTLFEDRQGRNLGKKLTETSKELLSPFLDLDISFNVMLNVLSNKDDSGKEIYQGETLLEGAINSPDKLADYITKKAGPGTYNNIIEFARANDIAPEFFGDRMTAYGREYNNRDAVLAVLGLRFSTINYNSVLMNRGYQEKDKHNYVRSEINRKLKTTNVLSEEKIEGLFREYQKANKETSESLIVGIRAARKFGVPEQDIETALKLSGFAKKDIFNLLFGIEPELKPVAKQTVTRREDLIRLNYSEELKAQEVVENYKQNIDYFNYLIDKANMGIKD